MTLGFNCKTCGQHHDCLPMDYGADAPASFSSVPEAERAARCRLTSETCVIDEKEFYVRGCLEIPVVDADRPLVWGVWTSISPTNFQRMIDYRDSSEREQEPPYFGWLYTDLTLYPDTLLLKTLVHSRSPGERPWVELEPTDHPLAIEQRRGITMQRVQQIAEALLH